MARGSKTTDTQSKKSTNAAKGGRLALKDAPTQGKNRRKASERAAEEAAAQPLIFDERTKRDIAGVAIAVVAVVLFVAAVLPPSGFITSALAQGLHMLFGIGAYVLPFGLVAVGVSFLARDEADTLALRLGIGLAMLFLSFETVLSLFTPGADADPNALFVAESLVARGGYLGAGVSWVFLKMLGPVVGTVIMVGVALGGAIIIGFSLSDTIRLVRDKAVEVRNRHIQRKKEREEEEGILETALDGEEYSVGRVAAPSARIRRVDPVPKVPRDLSRPRPASQSLNTQILTGVVPTFVQGGPNASSPDVYWPSDYAYDEAQAIADENHAVEAARTRVIGVEDGYEANAASADSFVSAPASSVMPASTLASAADSSRFIVPASAPLPSVPSAASPSVPFERPTSPAVTAPSKPVRPAFPWEEEPSDLPLTDPPVFEGDSASSEPAASAFDRRESFEEEGCREEEKAVFRVEMPSAFSSVPMASEGKPGNTSPLPKKAAAALAAPSSFREESGFVLPSLDLIHHTQHATAADECELRATADALQGTLEDFNIMATVVGWVAGPTVTLFKVDLPSGVRVSRIMALQDDIALALAAPGVRIFAPIPGTNHVGIEVPNKVRQNVLLGDVIKTAKGNPLEMAIGKDVEGRCIVTDLAKMPHLLIGGTTGSGKSVAINAMIMSILMRATPDEVRFIMIDPKRVEFTPYNGIPHLYVPVVTENKEAASALAWGVAEMERRLKVLSKMGVRNISQYNAKVESGAFDEGDSDAESPTKMPYIVIIIDELADLMMNVGKEVELSISRIAQLARAAGIHLIVATQRPSTNVVTGLIKANITNRIAFNVASGIDSRVILDTPGAENLIGLGDMLFSKPEYAKPQRLQGCFVSEDEIEAVVNHLKQQGEPEYHQEILQTNVIGLGSSMPDGSGGSSTSDDPLLWDAADIVVSSGLGSTSNIQRRLSVGYSRAGRIMDMLEEKGIVGPPNGSKPREVLVDAMELETLKAFEMQDAAEAGF